MSESIQKMLAARRGRYERHGDFGVLSGLSQSLEDTIREHVNGAAWEAMSALQREALKMLVHKIARIVNGDPDYPDTWRDIAGYCTRVAEILEAQSIVWERFENTVEEAPAKQFKVPTGHVPRRFEPPCQSCVHLKTVGGQFLCFAPADEPTDPGDARAPHGFCGPHGKFHVDINSVDVNLNQGR